MEISDLFPPLDSQEKRAARHRVKDLNILLHVWRNFRNTHALIDIAGSQESIVPLVGLQNMSIGRCVTLYGFMRLYDKLNLHTQGALNIGHTRKGNFQDFFLWLIFLPILLWRLGDYLPVHTLPVIDFIIPLVWIAVFLGLSSLRLLFLFQLSATFTLGQVTRVCLVTAFVKVDGVIVTSYADAGFINHIGRLIKGNLLFLCRLLVLFQLCSPKGFVYAVHQELSILELLL